MDLTHFKDLPDEARVWIHGFGRELNEREHEIIRQELGRFLPQWVSHEIPVKAAFMILHARFVVTAAHCQEGISGCSIDSLIRNFKTLATVHGLNGLGAGLVWYRDHEGKIQALDQRQFRNVLDSGMISSDTKVFDTLISTLGPLRSGEFEKTFERSWHARTFPLASC